MYPGGSRAEVCAPGHKVPGLGQHLARARCSSTICLGSSWPQQLAASPRPAAISQLWSEGRGLVLPVLTV